MQGQGQKDRCERDKRGNEAKRTRKTWGMWRDEVNKRGRKEDERFASGIKGMESEKAKDSKGNEERSKWLFRGLVTACGYDSSRQTEASCVCVLEEGLWKQRWGGNSSPSRLWKIKEALHPQMHTHTHAYTTNTHNYASLARLTAEKSSVLCLTIWQVGCTDAALVDAVVRLSVCSWLE